MKKIGLWLAIAALLVNGPRFVLIFLRVDGINIPLQAEAVMLGATGIATGLVLTGGGAYMAHRLAEARARGTIQFVMILCWFLLLLFSVILLAPLLVSAIRLSALNTVLTSNFFQWIWSITAVAAVEIISAGAMAAYALEGKKREGDEHETQHSAMSILTGALVRRLENSIAPQPIMTVSASYQPIKNTINSEPLVPVSVDGLESHAQNGKSEESHGESVAEERSTGEREQKFAKSERQRLLVEFLREITRETDIQVDRLADKFKVSQQTIYRDLADLKAQKRLRIEDSTVTVLG